LIVSASRRSDVPAFFGGWFLNRVREGWALAVNPFNPGQSRRVSLAPRQVAALVFWTKNPGPFLPRLGELDQRGFAYYFLHTLNRYPDFLEPGLPPLERRLETFKELARRLGPRRVVWRYDPIIISNLTPPSYHLENFARLAGELRSSARRVVISFLQMYAKLKPRLARAAQEHGLEVIDYKDGSHEEELRGLAGGLARIAGEHGLEIAACAEERDLRPQGVAPSACVDPVLLNDLFGLRLAPGKDQHQRGACGCAPSVDIGAYNTCSHGCLYCYANAAPAALARNLALHDPLSPCLVGRPPAETQPDFFP